MVAPSSTKIHRAIFIVLALLALAVRLIQLGGRPMHTDESINAYIVGGVLSGTPYHYDPQDRHGPALAEVTLPIVRLEGAKNLADLTETQLRLVPALVGAAGVLLFGAGIEAFGFIPCLVAALLFAFAPLPLYYSRYFIHETLFVVATLGLILAGNRALKKNSVTSAVVAGCCAAFMLACKETAGLHYFAMAIAALICLFWSGEPSSLKKFFPFRLWVAATVSFIVAGILLFTWGGQNLSAPADLIRSIPHFAERAGGEGHQKPFFYYLHLLTIGWSGWVLLLLAALGICRAVCPRNSGGNPLRRFIAIYAVLIITIYSLIPYKTPWLALNFWLPLALLIGLKIERVWQASPKFFQRVILLFAMAGITVLISHDVRQWVFQNPAGEKNPYAYAHTTEDVLGLPARIGQLCQQEHLSQPRIAVIAPDPWPLPWYLRKFSQTGYWQPGQNPGQADFYITTSDVPTNLTTLLKPFPYEFFGVRPNVLLLLWEPPVSNHVSPP